MLACPRERMGRDYTECGMRDNCAGGEKQRCGWLKDKYGLSWQIIPAQLGRMLQDKRHRSSVKKHRGAVRGDE